MTKIKTQPNLNNRISATIIDYVLIYSFTFWYIFSFGVLQDDGSYEVTGVMSFIPFLVWLVYFPGIESIQGQTLGHKLMSIKVVSASGKPITFQKALIRRIFDIVDIAWCFGLVAFFMVRNSPTHQRVGDTIAKTVVTGGESIRCKHCHSSLTLSAEETIRGHFNCPECSEQNQI